MDFKSITLDEELELFIQPLDKRDHPARVDGNPVWSVAGEVLTLATGRTPFHTIVRGLGPIDASTVTVTVDADLGEGVKPLSGSFVVAVVPGEASTLAISAGNVTPIAPTPAPEPAPVGPVVTETPAAPEPVAEPVEAVVEPVVEAPTETPVAEPVVTEPAPVETPVEAPVETVTEPVAEPVVETPAQPVIETPAEGGDTPAV